jgi:ribonuclease HI
MKIVVADVPPKFGMLLSRTWIKILRGTLQIDLTYATIPVFGGEHIILYREAQLAYIISDEEDPTNHPIFALDTELESSLFQLTGAPEPPLEIRKQSLTLCEDSPLTTSVWKMFFVSPAHETISLSYKLEFETTNNVAEYESLVFGLRDAKDMRIREIFVFWDAKLIFQQIKNTYQAKHPWLKSYINEAWDLIDSFFSAFNISFIPREENSMADSLAVSARNFRIPQPHKLRYDVEVKYRPSIPDNVKHWKFFEEDLDIKIFLETVDEFSKLHIDQDPDSDIDPHADVFLNKIVDHHIVQLPSNHIPKGLVPLEILFDRNDVAVKGKVSNEGVDIDECNIGTEEDPKFVKLSSSLSRE